MTMPQNQHYVPKFLLRNFTDLDGRLFRLNIKTDEITKPPPRNAASREEFYELSVRGRVVSFEAQFQKIESQAAPVIRGVINRNSLGHIDSRERERLANFVAAQSFRTEAFRRGLTNVSSDEMGPLLERLWESAFVVSAEIQRRRWALMVIEGDGRFYLGDQPVVLQHTEDPSGGRSLGFDVRGVEAYLPLTPKHALYMPCRHVGGETVLGYERAAELYQNFQNSILAGNLEGYRDIANVALIKRVFFEHRPLYESLVGGVPLVCATENIENLNYLQCAWAHDSVFSNTKDFSFARNVFERSPQYRDTMPTRVVNFGED